MPETGVTIVIPVFNKIEITTNCIDHVREFNKKCAYEIIVVDNGSTDKTEEVLSNDKNIIYIRNQENLGISKAYNQAAEKAKHDIFCFMHNDVFLFEKEWIHKIANFIIEVPDAGIVGLYGAKTVRKDGSFKGKTIVHSKKNAPTIKGLFERVAVVDGLLMAMQKSIFKAIEGFNEDFTVHFYDKDISIRAIKKRYMNYVLNIPFEHQCAATRKQLDNENKNREEARELFMKIWACFLPVDVTTWLEKLSFAFKGFNK